MNVKSIILSIVNYNITLFLWGNIWLIVFWVLRIYFFIFMKFCIIESWFNGEGMG